MVLAATEAAEPSAWALAFMVVWVGGITALFARAALNHRGFLDRIVEAWRRSPGWMRLGQSEDAFRLNQQRVSRVGTLLLVLLELTLLWMLLRRLL